MELGVFWVLREKAVRIYSYEHVARMGVRKLTEPLLGGVGPQLSALDRVKCVPEPGDDVVGIRVGRQGRLASPHRSNERRGAVRRVPHSPPVS
ncbi:hypothetical protein [Streptomyces sp. NPDC002547]